MVIRRDCGSEYKGEAKATTEKKGKRKKGKKKYGRGNRGKKRRKRREERVENGRAPFVIFRRLVCGISQSGIHGVESASVGVATLTQAGVRTTSGKIRESSDETCAPLCPLVWPEIRHRK